MSWSFFGEPSPPGPECRLRLGFLGDGGLAETCRVAFGVEPPACDAMVALPTRQWAADYHRWFRRGHLQFAGIIPGRRSACKLLAISYAAHVQEAWAGVGSWDPKAEPLPEGADPRAERPPPPAPTLLAAGRLALPNHVLCWCLTEDYVFLLFDPQAGVVNLAVARAAGVQSVSVC